MQGRNGVQGGEGIGKWTANGGVEVLNIGKFAQLGLGSGVGFNTQLL